MGRQAAAHRAPGRARRTFAVDGLGATLATENIDTPTDWCFEQLHHTIVVHLAGRMKRMELVFSGGPSSDVLPAIGDVWVIPAGTRYAALEQGDEVRFAELTLPLGLIGDAALAARIGHRDAFLHQAVLKLSEGTGWHRARTIPPAWRAMR